MRMRFHLAGVRLTVLFGLLGAGVPASAQTIQIDANGVGKVFDGVGAISGGGGNSRLLIDYAEPYRSRILDYLFKPGYGASLQIFKVEIGADMDSTDGAESSHRHTAYDENYQRGYEWWLMEEAKKRNPAIKLVALAWGAPGWVGRDRSRDGKSEYWSREMIDYIVEWIRHAESDHGLKIDYLGGRNEKGYNTEWYKRLRAGLRAAGLESVRVIASDDWEKNKLWNIATEMKKDPGVNDAIDVVGVHGPGWGGYPTADAVALGKPLWDSEGHFDEKPGYQEMARSIVRNYAAGKVTATIYWPIISAMYDNLPYDDIGLIKCNQPWAGHFALTPSVWVMAQMAQFTRPGWRFIDSASGFFEGDASGAHGSYVTLKSADSPDRKKDFSVVIETVDLKAPETARFALTGFAPSKVHVWTTDLTTPDATEQFVALADVAVELGRFSLEMKPGRMYTVTTTDGQSKGDAASATSGAFPFPYADKFDSYRVGALPKYFSDMVGAFETAACEGGRKGGCLGQLVPVEPISWKRTEGRPFTMLGDLEWTDYRLSSDVLLKQAGSVDLIGRLSGMGDTDVPNSYVLRVAESGVWSLRRTAVKGDDVVLARGSVAELGLKRWHRLGMEFRGDSIRALIDGAVVSSVKDGAYGKGMVGLGDWPFVLTQFDNFEVVPLVGPEP